MSSVYSGLQGSAIHESNARLLEFGAESIRLTRSIQRGQQNRAFKRFRGVNRTIKGGSGFIADLSDSDLDDVAEFEEQRLMLDFTSEVEAFNLEQQAANERDAGFGESVSGFIGGAGSLASTGFTASRLS